MADVGEVPDERRHERRVLPRELLVGERREQSQRSLAGRRQLGRNALLRGRALQHRHRATKSRPSSQPPAAAPARTIPGVEAGSPRLPAGAGLPRDRRSGARGRVRDPHGRVRPGRKRRVRPRALRRASSPRVTSTGPWARRTARRCSPRSSPSAPVFPVPRHARCSACQHKPTSRALQREAAPEFVPRFALLNGSAPPPGFATPFFVKPVVGRLSENARRINSLAALAELAEDGYPPRYARIAALAGLPEADVARVPGRGAPRRRRGHARGLRPPGPGHDDRRHRLAQVPRHEQLRRLRVPVGAAAGRGSRSWRASRSASSRRTASTRASSTWSSSCPRPARRS